MVKKIKPIENLPDDEWKLCLSTLETELDINWLQENGDNPIQILWQRTDISASQELYILSKAIENLKNINKTCLNQQINKIKSKDKNTCKGHCFEVIALSYFQNNYKMFPTPKGTPGVDGIIEYDDIQMNWSFKSFGVSQRQTEFENKSKSIETIIKNIFHKNKVNNFDITIFFTNYPGTDVWNSLEEQIIKDISIYNGQKIINKNEGKQYCYRIQNLSSENLANKNMSYIFNAICPYHKNEEKNFCSKLDDAVSNLLKYSSLKEGTKILKNALLIHIPDSIDISNCIGWGQNYLNDTNKHINLIAFYQTYIAQDENSFWIQHAWKYITKDLILKPPIEIQIPIGKITDRTMPLINKETGGTLRNVYVYQHGDIFNNINQNADGKLVGQLSSIAIGIKTNTVLSLPESKNSIIISPKIFSPDNQLLIL